MERTKFSVLRETTNTTLASAVSTNHWSYERTERHNRIIKALGDGELLASFIVDTDHPNGYEIHNIMSNGLILIQNDRTKKLVTELIARPQQLKRYWEGLGHCFPHDLGYLLDTALDNVRNGRNNW